MRDAFHSETLKGSEIEGCPPGYSFRVDIGADYGGISAPWIEHDGHGIIRTVCAHYGRPDKKPGEIILYSERREHWIYDIQATTEKATREGWGLSSEECAKLAQELKREPTAREIIARAVRMDADYCRGWLDGRYSWVSVCVTLLDPEGDEITSESVCGVEWDSHGQNTYAEIDTPRDLAAECLSAAGLTLQQRRAAWLDALREARERKAWAARGVATVGA